MDWKCKHRPGEDGGAIDRLTVLRTHGRPLTKCLRPDGSLVAYANAKHFTVREAAVGSLDDLVAAPIVEPGARDPLARRQGVLDGDDVVVVPELPASPLQPSVAPVAVTMRDLDETERATVVAAMRRSRLAARIWREDRSYSDRSKRDFAFAAGLVRGGCTSPEALAAALVALGEKHALGSKCGREDYVARTVTAALAAQREVARG